MMSLLRSYVHSEIAKLQRCQPDGLFPKWESSAAPLKIRAWLGIHILPTACRVMAKRRRDVCAPLENKPLWRAGLGLIHDFYAVKNFDLTPSAPDLV
jgi:hypothetical protein